jgi:hypothetical protein
MMLSFIPGGSMSRRTIYLPDSVEELARESTGAGESFSATVARLIEEGARSTRGRRTPRYVASGEGLTNLGRLAEQYLREPVESR